VWLNRVEGAAGCSFNPTTDFLKCPLGGMKAAKVRVVKVHTWLNSSPRSVVNDARVKSATTDPDPANNRSRLRFRLR
jgi:hypothetical protein